MGLFKWLTGKQKKAETADNFDYGTGYYEGGDPAPIEAEEVSKVKEEPTFRFKAVLSNSTLTVFLPSGDIVTNTDASKQLFLQVRDAKDEKEVRDLVLGPPPQLDIVKSKSDFIPKETEYDDEVVEAMPEIVATGEFTKKKDKLYLVGVDLAIPALLAKELLKAGQKDTSEYYDSLKQFWCWCALNPDSVAREDIFGFLERGDFKITKHGFFLGYRNVVTVEKGEVKSKALIEFITAKYLNIKTKQKKSPKNYQVVTAISDSGYAILGENPDTSGRIGNLAELYNQLGDMEDNEYTDSHTRSMKIKLGSPVKMPREKCDNNPFADCSRGLHIGNRSFGYDGFGNVTILVAVNPMNVVAVPNRNANKMRVCEYLPLGIVDNSQTYLEDVDGIQLEEEYADEQLRELVNRVSLGDDQILITQVADKLTSMQDTLSQRVVKVG